MTIATIYSKPFCPFCVKAENLLRDMSIEFDKIDISADPAERSNMLARTNGRTSVPQIFIGDRHIGGYDDLCAAVSRGDVGKR